MAIDINELNKVVLLNLVKVLNEDKNTSKRQWCLLSGVDDRKKYITFAVVDKATSTFIPIRIDRFNQLYLKQEVVYGVIKSLIDKAKVNFKKEQAIAWDWDKTPVRVMGRVSTYEARLDLNKGGKLHLFSWEKSVII